MSSSPVPYPLRMPEQLREYLTAQAKGHNRSLHAEIIGILQSAMDGMTPVQDSLGDVPVGVLLDEVIERLGARVQIVIARDVAEQEGLDPSSYRP